MTSLGTVEAVFARAGVTMVRTLKATEVETKERLPADLVVKIAG